MRNLPLMFAKNYIWIALNLSLEHKNIDLEKVKQIMSILSTYINQFVHD